MNYDTICYMGIYSAAKRIEVLIHAIAWVNLIYCIASTMGNSFYFSLPMSCFSFYIPLYFLLTFEQDQAGSELMTLFL